MTNNSNNNSDNYQQENKMDNNDGDGGNDEDEKECKDTNQQMHLDHGTEMIENICKARVISKYFVRFNKNYKETLLSLHERIAIEAIKTNDFKTVNLYLSVIGSASVKLRECNKIEDRVLNEMVQKCKEAIVDHLQTQAKIISDIAHHNEQVDEKKKQDENKLKDMHDNDNGLILYVERLCNCKNEYNVLFAAHKTFGSINNNTSAINPINIGSNGDDAFFVNKVVSLYKNVTQIFGKQFEELCDTIKHDLEHDGKVEWNTVQAEVESLSKLLEINKDFKLKNQNKFENTVESVSKRLHDSRGHKMKEYSEIVATNAKWVSKYHTNKVQDKTLYEKVERKLITQIQSLLNRVEHLSINIMNVDGCIDGIKSIISGLSEIVDCYWKFDLMNVAIADQAAGERQISRTIDVILEMLHQRIRTFILYCINRDFDLRLKEKWYISGIKELLEKLRDDYYPLLFEICKEYGIKTYTVPFTNTTQLKQIFEHKNSEFKKNHVDALNSLCIEEVANNNHKKHVESIRTQYSNAPEHFNVFQRQILSKNPVLSKKEVLKKHNFTHLQQLNDKYILALSEEARVKNKKKKENDQIAKYGKDLTKHNDNFHQIIQIENKLFQECKFSVEFLVRMREDKVEMNELIDNYSNKIDYFKKKTFAKYYFAQQLGLNNASKLLQFIDECRLIENTNQLANGRTVQLIDASNVEIVETFLREYATFRIEETMKAIKRFQNIYENQNNNATHDMSDLNDDGAALCSNLVEFMKIEEKHPILEKYFVIDEKLAEFMDKLRVQLKEILDQLKQQLDNPQTVQSGVFPIILAHISQLSKIDKKFFENGTNEFSDLYFENIKLINVEFEGLKEKIEKGNFQEIGGQLEKYYNEYKSNPQTVFAAKYKDIIGVLNPIVDDLYNGALTLSKQLPNDIESYLDVSKIIEQRFEKLYEVNCYCYRFMIDPKLQSHGVRVSNSNKFCKQMDRIKKNINKWLKNMTYLIDNQTKNSNFEDGQSAIETLSALSGVLTNLLSSFGDELYPQLNLNNNNNNQNIPNVANITDIHHPPAPREAKPIIDDENSKSKGTDYFVIVEAPPKTRVAPTSNAQNTNSNNGNKVNNIDEENVNQHRWMQEQKDDSNIRDIGNLGGPIALSRSHSSGCISMKLTIGNLQRQLLSKLDGIVHQYLLLDYKVDVASPQNINKPNPNFMHHNEPSKYQQQQQYISDMNDSEDDSQERVEHVERVKPKKSKKQNKQAKESSPSYVTHRRSLRAFSKRGIAHAIIAQHEKDDEMKIDVDVKPQVHKHPQNMNINVDIPGVPIQQREKDFYFQHDMQWPKEFYHNIARAMEMCVKNNQDANFKQRRKYEESWEMIEKDILVKFRDIMQRVDMKQFSIYQSYRQILFLKEKIYSLLPETTKQKIETEITECLEKFEKYKIEQDLKQIESLTTNNTRFDNRDDNVNFTRLALQIYNEKLLYNDTEMLLRVKDIIFERLNAMRKELRNAVIDSNNAPLAYELLYNIIKW